MYPAHYALGLAFHSRQKDDRLAVILYFLLGSVLTDLLWTFLTVAGIEGGHSMGSMLYHAPVLPWSHSLAMHAVWAIAWGGLGWALFRGRTIATLGALNVLVHYILDWAVLDMPLGPFGDAMFRGPGLYHRGMAWPFLVEAITIIGLWLLYDQHLRTGARIQRRAGSFGALIVMLLLHALAFGPTVRDVPAVDLGEQPTAVLGYTFLLLLGIGLLTATHAWATRTRSNP